MKIIKMLKSTLIPKNGFYIYKLWRESGEDIELVYIGKTRNAFKRVTGHIWQPDGKIFDYVDIFILNSKEDMDIAEKLLITEFKPEYNKITNWKIDLTSYELEVISCEF